ncbi:MAG TPA: hypothetical protein VGH28_11705 [Polyangiaceae bacterium]|jgi:hypothetical protein
MLFAGLLGVGVADDATRGGDLDPSQIERIHEQGYHEAAECIPVGGACGVLPLFGGLPAIVIGVRRRGRKVRS